MDFTKLESRLLESHRKLRLKCLRLEKTIREMEDKNQDEEKTTSQKFINFFATFFAQLTDFCCNRPTKRLKAIIEAAQINFESDFNVEFFEMKPGDKFSLETPAAITSAIRNGEKSNHGKIIKVLKLPYRVSNTVVEGKVEVVSFDQTLKENQTERADLFKDEEGKLRLAPIKVGKTLKKARTLEIPPIVLDQPLKLQIDPQILSTSKTLLWIGSTGKCLDIPTNHEDLYFLVTYENSFNLKLFSKNLQVGKLKLKE